MKLSKEAFFCLSDEKAEELKGKQVTVQMQEPRELIKGTVTGLLYMDPSMYESYKHIGQTKYMGIIINHEIQLKFNANIEYILINEVSDVLDRRGFFRKLAATTVPVIAGIALSPIFLSSCEKNGGNNPSCSGCANGCDNSCYRSCKTSCSANCGDSCMTGCASYCANQCIGECSGHCGTTCYQSCSVGVLQY